ncbi:glycoside hydrolase family 64 protein [Dactylosporangium sp. CS-033363]|uniref:glycoside hydrolase family 64 protein n=1 Tax=Dactylosporangium sp. CS-033363 TaxID=3239935 RepID=UPI003D8B8F6E
MRRLLALLAPAVLLVALAASPASAADFWGPTTGIPVSSRVMTFKVLNRTNGQYPDSKVFWTFNGQTHSIAEQQFVDVPVISAARMYFHLGTPTSEYSDFVELNTTAAWIGVNTTRVDGFGLKLALRVHTKGGQEATVGETQAVFAQGRNATFQEFVNAMPAQFKHLAQVQAPYRILAPSKSAQFLPGGQYQNYYKAYTSSLGLNVSTGDVFGCAGSLASNAALCGALNRHVAQLPQGQWGDVSKFYQAAPANYYARFWHNHAVGSKAYGFPYDDAANQSSFIALNNPQYMLIAVGW